MNKIIIFLGLCLAFLTGCASSMGNEPAADSTASPSPPRITATPTGIPPIAETPSVLPQPEFPTATVGAPLPIDPYPGSFETADLPPIANFGQGANVQLLAADGRRALQYTLSDAAAATTVAFALHKLTLEQFLDRYQTGFRGYQGQGGRLLSVEDAPMIARWSETIVDSPHQWANIQEAQIPADAPAGLYILSLGADYLNDQLLLILSDQRLVVKQAEAQLLVWVTDQGRSAADVPLTIYDAAGQLIENGRTDAQGFYQTQLTAEPLLVAAQIGDDISFSGLSDEWRYGTGPLGWWAPPAPARQFAVYSYTDRPIYHPGQTVYFKAIVRQNGDAGLDILPTGSPITAHIRDAQDNILQTFDLAPSSQFGAVHGQFQLAEETSLGDYRLELLVGADQESHRQQFKVEEYRPSDYAVTLTSDADYYLPGDAISVTVEGGYYSGEPVANAAIEVNLFHLDGQSQPPAWYMNEQRTQRGRTDENGRFTFTLPAAVSNYAQRDWLNNFRVDQLAIEAALDDGGGQTVRGLAFVAIYSAGEQLRLDLDSYAQRPGEPFTVGAAVLDLDGQPVNGRSLSLSLRRHSPTQGYNEAISAIPLTTAADGRAAASLTVADPGHYQLRLEGVDGAGNQLTSVSYIYVFAPGRQTHWFGREDRHLEITADQIQYAPGDVAELMIESTFDGPALLTIERGDVRHELLVELASPLTSLPLAIQADDAPNIFVTVHAWREQETVIAAQTALSLADAQLYIASVELHVPVSDKILNVAIIPDQESYAPRGEASFTLRVTNWEGAPVAAELSLALVNEAAFALNGDLAGSIYGSFYAPRPNLVYTYHSLAPARDLLSADLGGGDIGLLPQNLRSGFLDTAVWQPVLQTDANGEATVNLTLPDNLTSWRLTVKAVAADTQVGEATRVITVR
jgi:alpha-2-macroglobulin